MTEYTTNLPEGMKPEHADAAIALFNKVFHIDGGNANKVFDIRLRDLHVNGAEYVIDYGMGRGIRDKIGAAELKDDTVRAQAIAESILTAWKNGTVRRAGGRASDPLSVAMRKYAESIVTMRIAGYLASDEAKAEGLKKSDFDVAASVDEWLAIPANRKKALAKAKESLKEAAEMAEDDKGTLKIKKKKAAKKAA